jgi:tetratricopeptide (TPR) repeat protein
MRWHTTARLAAVLTLSLLAACDTAQNAVMPRYDHAADRLPLPAPAVEALSVLPGAQPLPEAAERRNALVRAFFARDFPALDPLLNQAHQRYVDGQSTRHEGKVLLRALHATQLAGVGACDDWLAAMPRSYAAHWVCGAVWRQGAWVARGGDYASKVAPVRFALMRERLQRSNELLHKALELSPKPLEALGLLGDNLIMLGDRRGGKAALQRAEQIMPADPDSHHTRVNFALPEWGGSLEKANSAIEHARGLGVAEDELLAMQDHVARPHKLSNPGAEPAYWANAVAQKSTPGRLRGWTNCLARNNNWREVLRVASLWIEAAPDQAQAYWHRAVAHERLGQVAQALRDHRQAAALGNDASTQALIQAHLQGALGQAPRDWPAMLAVCRYGVALGSASAANCLGSIHWEGASVGALARNDVGQSLAWHLVAARAGHFNSQYDLGWLAFTHRAPGMDKAQARDTGVFWLRRAAEQEHAYAKKKLEEAGYDETEIPAQGSARGGASLDEALRALWALVAGLPG